MSFLAAGEKVVAGIGAGLYAAGTAIMADSQALVPVDTGTLKRSGQVEEPVLEGDSMSVTLGYAYGQSENPKTGEPVTGYAIYVEMRDDVTHTPPTQAHFLQQAADAHHDDLPLFIQEGVKMKLGGV